jgi:hypothetical protein
VTVHVCIEELEGMAFDAPGRSMAVTRGRFGGSFGVDRQGSKGGGTVRSSLAPHELERSTLRLGDVLRDQLITSSETSSRRRWKGQCQEIPSYRSKLFSLRLYLIAGLVGQNHAPFRLSLEIGFTEKFPLFRVRGEGSSE